MSTASTVINGMIEQKLLNLHTAYFAKVISVSGNKAKIQPLNMIKATGKEAKKQSVITVPILESARKFSTKKIKVESTEITIPTVEKIEAGDIVYCLCGERDITDTKNGEFAIPPLGYHRLSDSVIIGVM